MKKLIILSAFVFLIFTLHSNAQVIVSSSSLTGVKLPSKTYREANMTTLAKTVSRMDSLVSMYNPHLIPSKRIMSLINEMALPMKY